MSGRGRSRRPRKRPAAATVQSQTRKTRQTAAVDPDDVEVLNFQDGENEDLGQKQGNGKMALPIRFDITM